MINRKYFDRLAAVKCLSWRWVLEDPRRLSKVLAYQLTVVTGHRTKEWGILSLVLAKRICRMKKLCGALHTALYFKQCRLSLMKATGSTVEPVSYYPSAKSPLVSLNRSGLPRIIPSNHRKIIGKDSPRAQYLIRCYLTILSFYRVIDARGSVSLDSITDPSPLGVTDFNQTVGDLRGLLRGLRSPWSLNHLGLIVRGLRSFPLVQRTADVISWSTGPNSGRGETTFSSLDRDATAFSDASRTHWSTSLPWNRVLSLFHSRLYYPGIPAVMPESSGLVFWSEDEGFSYGGVELATQPLVPEPIRSMAIREEDSSPIVDLDAAIIDLIDDVEAKKDPLWLGRLGLKWEPAGKVRLFAMLDSWSQRILYPLHEWVMDVLRQIPQDGTFAQLRPLRYLKGNQFWSLDLKSATDRFPIMAQEAVLVSLFGESFAGRWRILLTNREFCIRIPVRSRKSYIKTDIRFAVGQPLGAYSSWAVFSLTHHLIVQLAACYSGFKQWFTNYAILGDDILIGHPKVQHYYQKIMQLLGVPFSEGKGWYSDTGSYEFAQRFIRKGVDLSPLSFAFVASARLTLLSIPLLRRLQEFREVSWLEAFAIRGAGYKVKASLGRGVPPSIRWRRHYLILLSPRGFRPLPWAIWFGMFRGPPAIPWVSP